MKEKTWGMRENDLVKKLFKVAEEENYGFISHGATGKRKDQFLEE